MRNKKLFLYLLLAFCLPVGFVATQAYGWNYLMSVDNAEHLAVDFSPWWQQLRYGFYSVVSLIPSALVYVLIGSKFGEFPVSRKFRFVFSSIVFVIIFVSGLIGDALGTIELQTDTRKQQRSYAAQKAVNASKIRIK